tara:strand:+ start:58324 stop:60144 length:1821 start_codon:yes stop_codon:yes gene_type:complete
MNEFEDAYTVDEIISGGDVMHDINCKIKLKNHQNALISKCIELENGTLNIDDDLRLSDIFSTVGIIGDKVGSGKSYSVLGLFLANPNPKVRKIIYQSVGMGQILFKFHQKTYNEYLNTNVIVCSFGLLKQWKEYVSNFSDDFIFMVISSQASLKEYKKTYTKYNLIIVSNSFYRYFSDFILSNSIHLNRCVFDEVDSVRIECAKEIPTYFTWCVTATYKNVLHPYPGYARSDNSWNGRLIYTGIQNNSFIKNIFMSIIKQLYNTEHIKYINKLVIKCSDTFVDESFKLVEPITKIHVCENTEINILSGITNINIIHSLNAGDVKTAISYLNKDKVCSETYIVSLVKETLNIELSNLKIKINSTSQMTFQSDELKNQRLCTMQKNVESLEEKLQLLENRIVESAQCNICFDDFKQKTITTCCNNSFCFHCICQWINQKQKSTCPLCKRNICSEDLYVVTNDEMELSNVSKMKDKYETLETLLHIIYKREQEKKRRPKIVIFSEFDNTFDRVQDILNKMNIKYAFLKGNNINITVANFKNMIHTEKPIDILLVNCKSYGSGLNLENTTDLIMFHKFDSQIEKQVIGRAQRPGRKENLNIHYLLYKNEL